MPPPASLLLTLGSYPLGCLTTAYCLVQLRIGGDIRSMGSGNAGACNAGRALGPLVLLLDAAKGALVVWIARSVGFGIAGELSAMLAVVAGHVWPDSPHTERCRC